MALATSRTEIQLTGSSPDPRIAAFPAATSKPACGRNEVSKKDEGCTITQAIPLPRTAVSISRL